MRRPEIQRGAFVLLLTVLLAAGLARADEPDVPDWAEGWKKTWLQAYENGSLQLTAKVTPRYLTNSRQDVFAILELRSLDFPTGEAPAASVVLIIDRSASTAGRRLLIAKKAALSVMDGMSDKDHLSIIRVSDKPDVLPIQPLTPDNREKMRAQISGMQAVGRSDLSAGLDAAFEELSKPTESNNYRQVILFSDGRPTDGMVDQDGLANAAEEARQQHGIHVNTVAIGEDADIDLMAGMAKHGWGFAATLNDSSATRRISTRRQLDLIRRAATKAELRVKVGPTVTLHEVMGMDSAVQGNLARIPIGEIGPAEVVRVVLHLSTDNVGTQVRPIELAQVELEYVDGLTDKYRNQSLNVQAELNPAKAKGRDALDLEAVKYASLAFVEQRTARADETAEDGNTAGAKDILDETRQSLKQLGSVARLETADAMALFEKRSNEILGQSRPKPKPDLLSKKTKAKPKTKAKKKH
jgi:Ca-activated chloride channel family protein